MKLVVGLGNPGSRYRNTRHNLGFMVVDAFARRYDIDTGRERFQSWIGSGEVDDQRVVLAKPTTFMNRSGQAVVAMVRFYKLEPADLLVVTDDLALPLGKLRIRPQGSAGGHNGLDDIVNRLGTEGFARLRIGIDSPTWNAAEHVLGAFDEGDLATIAQAETRAVDAAICWITDGVVTAMNRYNQDA